MGKSTDNSSDYTAGFIKGRTNTDYTAGLGKSNNNSDYTAGFGKKNNSSDYSTGIGKTTDYSALGINDHNTTTNNTYNSTTTGGMFKKKSHFIDEPISNNKDFSKINVVSSPKSNNNQTGMFKKAKVQEPLYE